jgi:SNF2 family DNA or RNA helicase
VVRSDTRVLTRFSGRQTFSHHPLPLDFSGMVGDDALVDYPHPRHACAVFKFESTTHITHCPNCWYAPQRFPPRRAVMFFRLLRLPRGCPVPLDWRTDAFFHKQRHGATFPDATPRAYPNVAELLSSTNPFLNPQRCYCCDVQAPCKDWAVHCDAKSGQQKWDAMRRKIQSGAGARAVPLPYGGAGFAAPRPEIDPIVPMPPAPIVSKDDEMATRPALVTQMPDPRTLPSVTLLGTVQVPIALRGGFTATSLNAKIQSGAPFGVRCSSYDTAVKYIKEKMNDNSRFGLLNLLNTDDPNSYSGNSGNPKYLEVLPMIRPGDPAVRTHVLMRVLVVDSLGKNRPKDIAVEVPVNGTIGDIVGLIRETCRETVSSESRVLLANVVYRAHDNDPVDPDSAPAPHRMESKISRVYTTFDDSSLSKPAREVKGFARDFPEKCGFKFEHHNRGLGIGKVDPCRANVRDVLVAYILPKDAKQLAVVNPTYMFDFARIGVKAKAQAKDIADYDVKAAAKKAAKESDDAAFLLKHGHIPPAHDYRYGYHHNNSEHEDQYARSGLKKAQYFGTLGIPIVVPARLTERVDEGLFGQTELTLGGETQDADIAQRVKCVLESCVSDAGAAPTSAAPAPRVSLFGKDKGKRQAVANEPAPKRHLPLPLLLHTESPNSHHTSFHFGDAQALDDVRLRKAVSANGEPVKQSFAKTPKHVSKSQLNISPWDKKGFLVHGVTAVFDYAQMTATAKALIKKDLKLLPGGAEKHATAIADEKASADLYKCQASEDGAAARSNRLIEEIMRASVTFHVEVKPHDHARNPASRHPSRLRWKPFHPLVRTVVTINPVSQTQGTLEISLFVKNEDFKKPNDENTRMRLFNGPLSWTCRSLLDASATARITDGTTAFSSLGAHKNVWSYWHGSDLQADFNGAYTVSGYNRGSGAKSGNGDALHETLTTLFWGDKLLEFRGYSERAREDGGARSIPEFMKRLEMHGRSAATQPVGLAVEMREYQLQSLARMLELEAAPGGMRNLMWIEVPSVTAKGAPVLFSPFFRLVLPQTLVPALPKGGFLCEEMGLGKTIEVLGLVLSNPPPRNWLQNGDPVGTTCVSPSEHAFTRPDGAPPHGIAREAPALAIRSTATLVVCAVSLVGQWIDEARSKLDAANGLRIHMYHGQKRVRDPVRLANDYDLVVTTYQTIASDRGKVGLNHPTAQIEWYRIVLDEAHMAKSATTTQSKACHELRSARRWACTGTPMGADINDLHGQLKFLGAYPCQTRSLFEAWFRNPLSRTGRVMGEAPTLAVELMASITVRHTKEQTLNGRKILELPKKTESFVEVTLDKEERKKYLEVHAAAKARFDDTYAARGDAYISSKILSVMSLLTPLRRLCSGGKLTAADLDMESPHVQAARRAREAREREELRIAAAGGDVKLNGNGNGGAKAEPNVGEGDENAAPGDGEMGRGFRVGLGDNDQGAAAAVDAKPVVPAPVDGADKACGICAELCDTPMRTGCGHFFCTDCLLEHTTRVADAVARGRGRGRGRGGGRGRGRGAAPVPNTMCECPQVGCRALIDASGVQRRRAAPVAPVAPGPATNDDDDEYVPPGALALALPNAAPLLDDEEPAAPVVIQSDSKLRAIVEELRAMRAASPANKALIFSQFTSTLTWLQEKLPAEGFGFRTVSGSMPLNQRAAAIAAFQKDPPTTVFLLSMRSGAVGINLTSATHVFLVEPALNPALTEQAIGRSWRMGQVNEVSVKHLIVKNSVESNIVALLAERKVNNVDDADEAAAASTSKMSKSEIAGHLKADKQRLKKNELELLFSLDETRAAAAAAAAAAGEADPAAAAKKKRGRA